jgi:hypothetical protein
MRLTIADNAITKMDQEFKNLTINGIDDKEGYNVVKKAKSLVVKSRNKIDNVKKEMKRDIDTEAKRLLARLEPIETQLSSKLFVIDEEIMKIEEEKKKVEQERISKRIKYMVALGMLFDGVNYSFQGLTISNDDIVLLNDEVFKDFLLKVEQKVIKEKERLAKIKEEEDAERERLRLKKIELDKKEKEIKEREEKLKRQEQVKKAVDEFDPSVQLSDADIERQLGEASPKPTPSGIQRIKEGGEKNILPVTIKSDAAKEKEAFLEFKDIKTKEYLEKTKGNFVNATDFSAGFKAGARWYKDFINGK